MPLQHLFEEAHPYWKEDYEIYEEESDSDDSCSASIPPLLIEQIDVSSLFQLEPEDCTVEEFYLLDHHLPPESSSESSDGKSDE